MALDASRVYIDPKEKDIQKAILQYLMFRGYLCKRNNAGMALKQYKGKTHAIRIGAAGWPDIEGLTKDGRYFGIEIKSKTGICSTEQIRIGKEIIGNKGIWFIARTVDDVIERGF